MSHCKGTRKHTRRVSSNQWREGTAAGDEDAISYESSSVDLGEQHAGDEDEQHSNSNSVEQPALIS